MAVTITIITDQSFSYNKHLNDVPFIKEIRFVNNDAPDCDASLFVLKSTPCFFQDYEIFIPALKQGETYAVSNISLEYKPDVIAGFTEAVKGTITGSLYFDEECIGVTSVMADLRPYDEISNFDKDERLRAAFVTPNHPEVIRLLSKVSDLKGERYGHYSITSYQSDRQDVENTVRCIYEVIQQQEIAYVITKPGYYAGHQRIRLVSEIMEEKQGNCLDMTCLFASVLEAAGINPVMVITVDHAFVGFWTEDIHMSQAVCQDKELIYNTLTQKRAELVLIECTLATKGKKVDYDIAVRYAYDNNIVKEELTALVDIAKARKDGVLPLPVRKNIKDDDQGEFTYPLITEEDDNHSSHVDEPEEPEEESFEAEEPQDKISRWKMKLLDLTASSDLLNIKLTPEGKRVARIDVTDIYQLYEKMAQGILYQIALEKAEQNLTGQYVLHMNNTEQATNKLLTGMYSKVKEYREQKGVSVLYMTFGTLRWHEIKNDKWYDAPILMMPVEFKKEKNCFSVICNEAEIQLNMAVLEMLKIRFDLKPAGLYPVPMGMDRRPDLKKILKRLTDACKDRAELMVDESVHFGIFSFGQLMMWNDLDKNEELFVGHPIIHSMEQGIKDEAVNKSYYSFDEKDIFLPLSADGAQIKAMKAALGNQSFVLHGPPGTGKSQTITGMLANFIGHGRNVLFAAEKASALQVVYERMKRIGLEKFCLYLPVDSVSRQSVERFLTQYKELMEEAEATPTEYEDLSRKIEEIRGNLEEQLSLFVKTPYEGYTLMELAANVLNDTECMVSTDQIGDAIKEQIYAGRLKELEDQFKELMYLGHLIGNLSEYPLRTWGPVTYRFGMQRDLRKMFREYISLLDRIMECNMELSFSGKTERVPGNTVSDWKDCRSLLDAYHIPAALRGKEDLLKKLTIWLGWLDIQEEKNKIYEAVEPGIEKLDLKRIANKWKSVMNAYTADSKLEKLILKNELAPYIHKDNPSDRSVTEALKNAVRLRQLEEEFPDGVGFTLPLSRKQTEEIREYIENNFPQGLPADVKYITEDDRSKLEELSDLLKEKERKEQEINEFAGINLFDRECGLTMEEWKRKIELWLEGLHTLREWCDYQQLRLFCMEAGLGPWILLYEEGIEEEKIIKDFLSYSCQIMLCNIYETEEKVREFAGYRFDALVKKYEALMEHFCKVSGEEIKYRHLIRIKALLADPSNEKDKVELKRIIEAGGKGTTIREIVERIGGFLLKLSPCVMATPMTTSMYFPPKAVLFDHMLLDEASQLQTYKAVGLIVRSKNSIIVGDPNQMPPTSFFETGSANQTDVFHDDQESILKDFIALDMPDYYLRWHYRSHDESLIAFSNSNYYGGKMITFPAVGQTSRVRVIRTDGIYDRGNTMTNPVEAGVLVEYLKKMLLEGDNRSVGIVAFNKRQQAFIEELLEKECEENPELAQRLSDMKEKGEELFVRNLESVQGDERDVILFSIGYGADKDGKILMTFGPLGKVGGWRRLNVAITRARDEMILFTSMDSDQMVLSDNTSRGVKELKEFMAYAEGKIQKREKTDVNLSGHKEGFENVVCSFLEEAGYDVDRNVGNSSLRIDIGVRDVEENSYILGIMLDSLSTAGDFSVYDSEIGMNKMLESQGWNLLRIWSLDWYEDEEREKKRILDRIKERIYERA